MSEPSQDNETVYRYADQVTDKDLLLPKAGDRALFQSDLDLQSNPELGKLLDPGLNETQVHSTPDHFYCGDYTLIARGLMHSALIRRHTSEGINHIGRTLFTPDSPYYSGGHRIIRGNRYFRVIQEYGPEGDKRIEMSKALELAYFQSLQKRKDTTNFTATKMGTTLKERVELGSAFEILAMFYRKNQKALDQSYQDSTYDFLTNPHAREITGLGGMIRLGSTLGKHIEAVLELAEKTARENEGVVDLKEIKPLVREVSQLLEGALEAVIRKRLRTMDGRSKADEGKTRPKPHHVIEAARSLYFQHGDLPSKQSVAGFLLSAGKFTVTGQRPSKEWKPIFEAANLSDLTEQGAWSALYPKSP